MANKRFYQFLYSKQPKLTMIAGNFVVGATGAVGTVTGGGVQGITRLAAGVYKLKMVDNYYAYVNSNFNVQAGITGSSVAGGSFVATTLYQIQTLGTTTQAQWVTAGFDADYTAAVGGVFVAAGVGAGTGTVKAIGATGIQSVEVAKVTSSLLVNLNPSLGRGSSLIISMMGATDASTTTMIAKDPADGSSVAFQIWFRDSSVSAL